MQPVRVPELIGVRFDGMFCFNDALALGAQRALWASGVRIPDDVALIGFDDTEDSRFATPALSTVNPHRDLIAAHAVELLRARIADGNDDRSRLGHRSHHA